MIIGQTIAAEDTNPTTVWTPFVPRQGNTVSSAYEIISISGNASLTVALWGKNSTETGDGAAVATDTARTATGTYQFEGSDIKELVHYKIVLTRTSGSGAVYCTFRILNPSWNTTGAQGV